jgi:hypothetical protein
MTTLVLEHLQHADSASPDITIDSNGRIGIGTNTPGSTLNVVGSGRFDNSAATPVRLHINNSGSNDYASIYADTSSAYKNLVINPNGGNVGIGTTSPGSRLTVQGTLGDGSSEAYIDGWSIIGNRYQGNTMTKLNWAGGGARIQGFNSGVQKFEVSANSSTYFNGGNVGIGTTGPEAKLHVYNENGGNATNKATMLSEAVLKLQPHTTNSTNLLVAQVNNGNGIGLQVTNGPATANWDLALSPFGGKVGVGTATPLRKLHISDVGDTHIMLQSTNAVDDSEIFEIGAGANSAGEVDLTFRTRLNSGSGGAEHMRITNDGYVTTPNQPGFWVRLNGDQTGYNPGYYNHSVIYNYKQFDVGNNVDTTTGLFTAPVDGVYIFFASAYSQTNTFNQAWFTLNGGRAEGADFVKASADDFVNCSISFKLSANDTVGYHPYGSGSNVTIKANVNHTWFRGHLIG